MERKHPQIFTHMTWTPSELQELSGLSPVTLRDLRRRNLAPKDETRKLDLKTVAQLFLLSELADHGFGPKSVSHIAQQFCDALRHHALQHRSSWVNDVSHAAWLKSSFGKTQSSKFILIERAGGTAVAIDDLSKMDQNRGATISLVNLEHLGCRLAEHLSRRPSAMKGSGQ
ncbi:hypothetical protein [Qipengyuania sp. RANM35]|uniref:hypothetical protein n=1 Tax=Qipengyuania sp. RANM35 TaxID=3068635 RepID=UPI0034DB1754